MGGGREEWEGRNVEGGREVEGGTSTGISLTVGRVPLCEETCVCVVCVLCVCVVCVCVLCVCVCVRTCMCVCVSMRACMCDVWNHLEALSQHSPRSLGC